ncbi:MAG: DNA-protecting protein DprA [Rubrobacter sp.]|nr:DNA-protecting protein DprA [Rubrobacter sp.]
MTGSERSAYLFLSLLQARTGTSFVSRLGEIPLSEIPEMRASELGERVRMTERATKAFDELRQGFDPESVLGDVERLGISVVTLADETYPERLKAVPDPPPALYVDGELPMPDLPSVALVGSRKASVSGLDTARSLGRALGERGVCVVSGLALGVDAAAHEGALEAEGVTVGVLGCGIDVVYPRSNRRLFGLVRESGAIVSEYHLGEAPLAWRFPARNRIISGLCQSVVVVEAAEKSGALITVRHALDAGADVWAVPGPPGLPECRGSNKLIADGAGCLWDIPEFVDSVAPLPVEPVRAKASRLDASVPAGLPEGEAAALAGVGFEPTAVDAVAGRSGMRMQEVLSALALLELKGYVSRDGSGAFVRRAGG